VRANSNFLIGGVTFHYQSVLDQGGLVFTSRVSRHRTACAAGFQLPAPRTRTPFGRALLEADSVQRTVARILESASQDMAARERSEDDGGRATAPLAVTASNGNQ
jgi:hypothetical protein